VKANKEADASQNTWIARKQATMPNRHLRPPAVLLTLLTRVRAWAAPCAAAVWHHGPSGGSISFIHPTERAPF
jgi:hypothetical protein